MEGIHNFFSSQNTVRNISKEEQNQTHHYLEAIKAFARTTYKSIYIIDYQKKSFEFVSENPLFLCDHSAEEVKKMGFLFYYKHVVPEDLELLQKINIIGFNFYDRLAINERLHHSISYDFHLKNQKENTFLINQKLTPLFLTNEGKIWKAVCIVSLSNEQTSGNIKIMKNGENTFFEYDLKKSYWKTAKKIQLSDREKQVVKYSVRGFTINEMANLMHISHDTVKFHRKKLFEKLNVNSISEAIAFSTNNKLI